MFIASLMNLIFSKMAIQMAESLLCYHQLLVHSVHLMFYLKFPFYFHPVPFLIWADYEPGEELNSEKDDDKVVDEVDDEDDAGEVNLPLLVLLQLLSRRDDEGDGGDHHLISKRI